MNLQERYLQLIHQRHPDLAIEQVQFRQDGQFNDVLIINDAIVFRFPRTEQVILGLWVEKTILSHIQAGVPLPVPRPIYASTGTFHPGEVYLGYGLIPGQPLTVARLERIPSGYRRSHLARQLGRFLQALHDFPSDYFGIELPEYDTLTHWENMYAEIREKLFAHMRPDARTQVADQFERALGQPEMLAFTPRLRHGDFGPGNILFDEMHHQISGVIDFSEAGLGDPAVDLAAISVYGDAFVNDILPVYPALVDMRPRARFYRSTFALQEALSGLRDGDPAAFQRGIESYR